MGGAVRVGETVRRPAGAWTPTVQRLLCHLREQGLDWVPELQGATPYSPHSDSRPHRPRWISYPIVSEAEF